MFRILSVFIIFLFICLIWCNEEEDNEVFIATNEWQTVKKGQKIPKGLHVRINLETGQTEAKLLDEDETVQDKTKALSALPTETPLEEEKNPEPSIQKSDLEEALKNIKSDELLTPEEIKSIKDKFRSYDEIKQTLGELNLTPKLESEVIADLIKKHNEIMKAENYDKEELLKIIEDLDFLVHQYDNAHEFIKLGGFQDVIYKHLNSSKSDLKKETLKLMASMLQNNVSPKIHALESGAIGVLLRIITFETDSVIKHRALSAVGALLRSFPAAQKKFVDTGGLAVLSKFFENDSLKIQIKLITMISDLIVEHKFAATDEKLNQYYKFDLTKHILEHDWCTKLNKLLLGLLVIDKDDHDSVEKCITAMHSLRTHCGDKFQKDLVISLKNRYQKLSSENIREDNNSNFFKVLKDLCDEILHYIHNSVKTEL